MYHYTPPPPPPPVLILQDNLGDRYVPKGLSIPSPLRLEPLVPPPLVTVRPEAPPAERPRSWNHPVLEPILDLAFHILDGRHFH